MPKERGHIEQQYLNCKFSTLNFVDEFRRFLGQNSGKILLNLLKDRLKLAKHRLNLVNIGVQYHDRLQKYCISGRQRGVQNVFFPQWGWQRLQIALQILPLKQSLKNLSVERGTPKMMVCTCTGGGRHGIVQSQANS